MPSRIVFLPIEPYKSRYTQYTSTSNGVYETCFRELGIKFFTIRTDWNIRDIKHGQVLDVVARTNWAFNQVGYLVDMIMNGAIDPLEDVIYLEDFWTPGFEMIMYAMSSKYGPNPRYHPKIYSFCHAQSIDPYDFTAKWAWWMRPLEKVWFDYQENIFCAAKEMIPLLADAGFTIIANSRYKILPVGHAFSSKAIMDKADSPTQYTWEDKKKQVVFASRWDSEKNPAFFMDLIHLVLKERTDINFVICTGQPRLTSNDPALLERITKMVAGLDPLVKVLSGLSLNHYYSILSESKVLFNCALQDWISYVLLDGCLNNCAPLFPKYLSFPEALENNPKHLYKNMNLDDAKKNLYALVDSEYEDVAWVYNKYEKTVSHMCKAMGFKV